MQKREYIGKKVIGFKFEDSDSLAYTSEMNQHVGEKGKIIKFEGDVYYVKFSTNGWWYPAREIEEQLAGPIVVEPELTLEETLEKIKNL